MVSLARLERIGALSVSPISLSIRGLSASKRPFRPAVNRPPKVSAMATGFAYYNVPSVDKFIEVFSSEPVDTWRKENGCTTWRVFKVTTEPSQVAVVAEYPSLEALQKFKAHPKTRELMSGAGLQGPPLAFLEMETIKQSS